MSSIILITPVASIPLSEWQDFCREQGLQFIPNIVGQNTFSGRLFGGCQVQFGKRDGSVPERPDGSLDFAQAKPPSEAEEICLRISFMDEELSKQAALLSLKIIDRWSTARVYCSPEFESLIQPTECLNAETRAQLLEKGWRPFTKGS